MRVLVVDTALGLCTVGVFEVTGEVIKTVGLRSEAMLKGHQERLGGLARDAVAEAGGFGGLERIGVTVGPGSFTGLRVGMAFAQGLGAALDRPVVGLSTLDALAASVDVRGDVAALIDARRGQVYARIWRDRVPIRPAAALEVDAAAAAVQSLKNPTLVGSGAPLMGDVKGSTVHLLDGPAPEALARLTARAVYLKSPVPLYLRAPDATPPSRRPGEARAVRPPRAP